MGKNKHPQWWSLRIGEQRVLIERACFKSRPCRHEVRGLPLSTGLEIWHAIRDIPALEKHKPGLWAHFSHYEAVGRIQLWNTTGPSDFIMISTLTGKKLVITFPDSKK